MAGPTIFDLPEVTDALLDDIFYLIRGSGAGRDRQIKLGNLFERDNLLDNGNFRFAQRGDSGSAIFTAATSPANNNKNYLLDRWALLSDGNDAVDISQETDIPNNRGLSLKHLVTATNDKKFGQIQIIKNAVSQDLQDKKVSLAFWAKTTTAKLINNVRAAVLSWDGTADTVTDPISAWGASGANPTLSANWTAENVATDLALTTSWQQFKIENIDLDTSGIKNIAVFIWTDDTTTTATDEMFLAEASLNIGEIVAPVKYRTPTEELIKAQDYYEKSYDLAVAPGTAADLNGAVLKDFAGGSFSFTTSVPFKGNKRVTPSVNTYATVSGNINNMTDRDAGPAADVAAVTQNIGEWGFEGITTPGGVNNHRYNFHFVANAELIIT